MSTEHQDATSTTDGTTFGTDQPADGVRLAATDDAQAQAPRASTKRPPKGPTAEVKRDKIINFRVTEDEYRRFVADAGDKGVGTHARDLCFRVDEVGESAIQILSANVVRSLGARFEGAEFVGREALDLLREFSQAQAREVSALRSELTLMRSELNAARQVIDSVSTVATESAARTQNAMAGFSSKLAATSDKMLESVGSIRKAIQSVREALGL